MTFVSGIQDSWRKIWRSADIPDDVRKNVRKVQVERALTHLPTVYAVAIFNMFLVIALCWHEGLPLSHYIWMGLVIIGCIARMARWVNRSRKPYEIKNPDRMLWSMTIISVGGISALSAWTVYSLLSGSLNNMTLIPISLVFGSSCIAHCIAPIKRAAIYVLLAGVVPSALVMMASPDFEVFLLGTSMLTITFLMCRFIAASYNHIISGILLEQQVGKLAYTDALTGLANRRAIMRELREAEQESRDHGTHFAIAMLDLDGFKQVNDTLGHHVGDALLETVAERLLSAVQPHEHVGRLGGDEFIILMRGIGDEMIVSARTTAFIMSLTRPAEIEGHIVPMAGSIGYALHPADGETASHVMKIADERLYATKKERKSAQPVLTGKGAYQPISLPS